MFKKASKSSIKLRLALSGSSGSGKTFSALAIASYLGKSIAVIDTEKGSASRYADKFDFDVCELSEYHPARYIELIKMAQESYDVVIIDSLSHAWFAELEMAESNFKNWAKVRPIERKLIEAMTGAKCHIIATMRSKTEWILEETTNKQGKTTMSPRKVGMAPIQTSGIEYEFDVAGDMDYNHMLTIGKSRCSELADRTFLNPGKELASILKAWTASDATATPQTQPTFVSPPASQATPQKTPLRLPSPSIAKIENAPHLQPQREEIQKKFEQLRWTQSQIKECLINNFNSELLIQLSAEQLNQLKDYVAIFEQSTDLIKKLNWSPDQGKKFLQQHYEKEGRASLTHEELMQFVTHLSDCLEEEEETLALESPPHY